VELGETTRTLEEKESKQFGVRTKYLRTICDAVLVRAFDAPSMQSYAPATEIPARITQGTVSECTNSSFTTVRFHRDDDDCTAHSSGLEAFEDRRNFSIAGRTIFVLNDESGLSFYTWVSHDEFKHISDAEDDALESLDRVLEQMGLSKPARGGKRSYTYEYAWAC